MSGANENSGRRSAFRSAVLVLESILFTIVVPATVTVWLPWIILGNAMETAYAAWGPAQYASLPLAGAGIFVYCWCVWDFVMAGRGIPAPIDHPKKLVTRGLYRYVRNPMYLGVLLVLLGEILFFWSGVLFVYTIAWFAIVNCFVVLHEEPVLRKKFGGEYERYSSSVRRWLPGGRYSD